jgi:hypothetical protein
MCYAVEPSFVHWMSLITKAATVFYYNRRGLVPEYTKYKAAGLVLFLNTPSTRQHIQFCSWTRQVRGSTFSSVPEHTK